MSFGKKLKSGWMAFVHRLGQIQTALILLIVYHVSIGPISLVARLIRRDLIGRRAKKGDSYAVPIEKLTTTMEQAQKQF
jgi:hypothetical protein